MSGYSIVGSLGQLPFTVSDGYVLTFGEVSRENKVRWAQHDVIGRKPVLEYVGEDLSTVSLPIRFDSFLGVEPKKMLDRLNRMLLNKQYKTLIIGGEYLGRFVLDSVSEVRKHHDGAGNCLVATATLTLTEWAGV